MNPALSNDELFKTLTEIYQEKILELKSLKVTISSGSMRPLIKPGELIICESKPEYKTGDIIVFFNGSKIIAHRIILIEGNKIFTQGDNNLSPDPIPTSKGNIIGVAKINKKLNLNFKSIILRKRNKYLYSLKTFIDKHETNRFVQFFLSFLYLFFKLIVKCYGFIHFDLKVFLGGSFARNQQRYGSSDLDYYFISQKESLIKHYKFMHKVHLLCPIINTNSIITHDLFRTLSQKGYFSNLKPNLNNLTSLSLTQEIYHCLRLAYYLKINFKQWSLKKQNINQHNIIQLCQKLLQI